MLSTKDGNTTKSLTKGAYSQVEKKMQSLRFIGELSEEVISQGKRCAEV